MDPWFGPANSSKALRDIPPREDDSLPNTPNEPTPLLHKNIQMGYGIDATQTYTLI